MIVENLLDCFKFYPDQITYFDTTNNIQDQIDLSGSPLDKFCKFIKEYGEYEVVRWEVSTEYIYIEIEKR